MQFVSHCLASLKKEKALSLDIDSLAKDDMRDIAAMCMNDIRMFAEIFLPDYFYIPFSSTIHDKMFDIIDNCDAPRIVIKAPRGVGKSTIFSFLWPLKKLLYRQCNFMVIASGSIPLAKQHSDNLRHELLLNPTIKAFQEIGLFPGMKPESREDDFSKDQWVIQRAQAPLPNSTEETFEHSAMVLPISWKKKVRGRRYGLYRPDFIISDDLEDPEEERSDTQTRYIKEWFNSDLRNLVQRSETRSKSEFPWQMVVVGTLLGDNTLMASLCDSKEWEVIELELANENHQSNWPEFMSHESIEKEYQYHTEQGTLEQYYLEWRGIALPPETAKFRREYFKYYKDTDLAKKVLQPIILIDPAKTKEITSAHSAAVCWGFDGVENKLYLLDLIYGALHPAELIEMAFEMAEKWSTDQFPCKIGYEKTGLDLYISWPIENYNREHGYNFELIALSATGDKDDRIFSLSPLYRHGQILHPEDRPGIGEPLELQLLRMPKSRRKDIADAGSYIVQMLGRGKRYFVRSSKALKVEKEQRMQMIRDTLYSRVKLPKRQRLYV